MTRHPANISATLLFAHQPDIDMPTLSDRLQVALRDDLGLESLHSISTRADQLSLSADDLTLDVVVTAAPLGAQAFIGAITTHSSPATRAAQIGAIARHEAHVTITTRTTESAAEIDANARLRSQVTHLATAELAAQGLHPLALHWSPANRLHCAADSLRLLQTEMPIELFLDIKDEVMGTRRTPGLRCDNARLWLNTELHVQVRPIDRETALGAALAFARSALADASALQGRSFHHDGTAFRIAHDPDGQRIDLIPLGELAVLPQVAEATHSARRAASAA